MSANLLFNILPYVDSTNNYAMDQIRNGTAKDGMAWFTSDQRAGKGQRGKIWIGEKGKNVALSVIFKPQGLFLESPFLFNALISTVCRNYLASIVHQKVEIKWPNDLYIYDRKAVGILIENNYRGKVWNWSVVGIGINVNQIHFSPDCKNPISIKQITNQELDLESVARQLHDELIREIHSKIIHPSDILSQYNQYLYKAGQTVSMKKEEVIFQTIIEHVDENGRLITKDKTQRLFQFGEVEWC